MTDLPFQLVNCAERAVVRIEVYTAFSESGEGSLDGAVYVCSAHPQTASDAIAMAGFASSTTPLGEDVDRPCGYVHIYPTGLLAASAHPSWCDREGCDARGEHRSRFFLVESPRQEASIISLSLAQTRQPPAEPVVVLSVADRTATQRVVFSAREARNLRHRLGDLLTA
ncbi:hypothetical protein ACN263_01085 [Micromonospora sp. WMMD729]|uniref:hypothetical protein n=1 Tax=Micromonospora sp. WMMD729 TaxID=3404127 RepID=UPI003BF6045C